MKTLIINGNRLLEWLAEHPQVWEDMLRHFNPEGKDYERVEVTPSEFFPIKEYE